MPTAPADAPPRPGPPADRLGGAGAAGAAWRTAVVLFAASALLFIVFAALLAWAQLDARNGDQDSRGWNALAAIVYGAIAAVAGFLAWAVALVLAALGRGRLARPVLGLGAAASASAFAFSAIVFLASLSPAPAALLAVAVAGLVASVTALRRPTASSP